MGIGDFFSDLGQWGSDLFTGRWMGGETNLAHDNWTPALALGGALATGGAALGAMGGLGGAGAGLGGLFGGAEAAAGGVGETALAGAGGLEGVLGGAASPEALNAFAFAPEGVSEGVGPASFAERFGAASSSFVPGGGEGGWDAIGAINNTFGGGSGLGGGTGVSPDMMFNPNAVTGGASFDAINNPLAYTGDVATSTAPEMTGAIAPGGTPGGGGMPMNLGGGGPSAPGGGTGSFWDTFTGNIAKQATQNPLGTAGAGIAALGLGANALRGNKTSQEEQMLRNQAMGLNSQAGQLMSYLQSGQLPPGLQAKLDQDKKLARAKAVAAAGQAGLSTDPKFNSALQQQFAAIDLAALVTQGQIANQLLQTGITELNLSANDLTRLMAVQQQRDKELGQSITAFAAALGRAGGSSSLGKRAGV